MFTDSRPGVKLEGATASQVKEKDPARKQWGAVRAEALSSAIFYSECTLNRVSKVGATHAEEVARSNQSKWWLPGNDPKHPSLQSPETIIQDGCKSLSSCRAEQGISNLPLPAADVDAAPRNDLSMRHASTDLVDVNEDEVEDDEAAAAQAQGNDINTPLFAQDNDFGTLPSLSLIPNPRSNKRTASPPAPTNCKPQHDNTGQLFGSPEDTIRLHSSYSRIYGPQIHQQQKRQQPNTSITDDSMKTSYVTSHTATTSSISQENLELEIKSAKSKLLSSLKGSSASVEVTDNSNFNDAVIALEELYQAKLGFSSMAPPTKKTKSSSSEINQHACCIDGTWLMISPPSYPACVGTNDDGEKMFTLGRMAFDMFQPADLVCSIQKQFNTIRTVTADEKLPTYIPPSLRREAEFEHRKHRHGKLKSHNIIASFTIEKGAYKDDEIAQGKKQKLKGILTNYGYTLSDPDNPNRKSIWFTAGTIEPADEESLEDWKELFGEKSLSEPDRTQYTAKARSLASTFLLGAVSEPMDERGTAGYYLTQPIGGHGYAYCDVIFMDAEIRVMRGHSGSVLVFRRVFF